MKQRLRSLAGIDTVQSDPELAQFSKDPLHMRRAVSDIKGPPTARLREHPRQLSLSVV